MNHFSPPTIIINQTEALRGSFDILNEGNSNEDGEHGDYLHGHNNIGLNPAYSLLTHGFNASSLYAHPGVFTNVFTSAELLKLSKGRCHLLAEL